MQTPPAAEPDTDDTCIHHIQERRPSCLYTCAEIYTRVCCRSVRRCRPPHAAREVSVHVMSLAVYRQLRTREKSLRPSFSLFLSSLSYVDNCALARARLLVRTYRYRFKRTALLLPVHLSSHGVSSPPLSPPVHRRNELSSSLGSYLSVCLPLSCPSADSLCTSCTYTYIDTFSRVHR